MEDKSRFSTKRVFLNVGIYFLLFLAGDLINSLIWDFVFSNAGPLRSEIYSIVRMSGQLLLTCLFFWLYTAKVLHLKMNFFRINMKVKFWGLLLAVLLPAFVIFVFLLIGKTETASFETDELILIVIFSILTALKAGITEEMLFRGFMMKLLESRWNKYVAVTAPSFLFSLLHIPSMETFSVIGVVLLIVSGTLVGVMFSVVAYKGNSIANRAVIHTVWNFAMITGILHITTVQGCYGNPVFSIIIPSENVLLTGAGFGVEASIIAVIGYACICAFCLISKKNSDD